MNIFKSFILGATIMFSVPALSQTAPASYTTSDTTLADLAGDPATKAIIDKHYPGLITDDVLATAGAMTLKSMQQFKPDFFTDKSLADTDADLAKIPRKK